jgi:hypothetical protein
MVPRRLVARAALLAVLVSPQTVWAQASPAAPTPATPPAVPVAHPAAAPPAAQKTPDVATIVERIQKRIDEEVGPPAAATADRKRPATKRPVKTAERSPEPAAPPRIHLSWRTTLVWPDALVGAPATPAAPAPVTVTRP